MATTGAGNRLLADLDSTELELLRPDLQLVHLERGAVLAEAGQPSAHLYFPVKCVLSLVGTTEGGATVEVAVIGRDGMASVSAALGRRRLPFRVVVQIEGAAWRILTEIVTRQMRDCRGLHERLLHYSHYVIAQVGQSAICNRFHNAKQRLARWLLMTADHADSRELPLTHEFISHMVGGPRSAVTEAAAALRESGAIDYRRGMLTIRSLDKLRSEACECYEAVAASSDPTP
ncbi:MAG TPA: Crp/Fnr family transcriptional regulator [Vicinamibacterales bacterium]|nr:Crp/Fnr family transcriptional regulator [Vicinamibacterales bacterium]